MKRFKLGFTIIEITLFMAITALLFAGIAAGTSNSIERQRYYDTVQNFAEFLRSVYSQVSNPQSLGEGRSDKAIYGKLITFGEKYEVDESGMGKLHDGDGVQWIYVYDVVGDADVKESGSVQKALLEVGANVVQVTEKSGNTIKRIAAVGMSEAYAPKWGMSIENIAPNFSTENNAEEVLFKGSILIVRHPRSGTINTLVTPAVVEVNEMVYEYNTNGRGDYENLLKKYLEDNREASEAEREKRFVNRQVDFCVNQFGARVYSDNRWDIRIVNNARNASGVEVIGLDAKNVVNGVQMGNKCRFSDEDTEE